MSGDPDELVEVSKAKIEQAPGNPDRYHPGGEDCRYVHNTVTLTRAEAEERFYGIRECNACGTGPSLHAKLTGTEVC